MERRIQPAQAAAALVVAFLSAQLAGKVVSETFASTVATRPLGADGVATLHPVVVVPAMLASELALLLVALLVPLIAALPVRESLGLRSAPLHVMLAAAFGTVMLGPVGDMLMTLLATLMPGASLGVVPALREVAQTFPLWLTWPAFALMPGVAEELLFRGVVQRSIVRPVTAIVVSGVAFAAFHVDPIHVVGVLPLGLFLSWVGQRAGTTTTIFAHLVNNTVALWTIRTGTMDVGYSTGHDMPLPWVAASVVGAVLAVRIIARATRSQV